MPNDPRRTWLDRALAFVAPKRLEARDRALYRTAQHRAAAAVLEEHAARGRKRAEIERFRSFDAGKNSPRTAGWDSRIVPPDAAPASMLATLQSRARDLRRNVPWAGKAVRALGTHIVGSGLQIRFRHKNPDVAREIQDEFARWANSTDCDADARTNLTGLSRQVVREVATAGETLARFRARRQSDGLRVPLQIELVPAETLDSTRDDFGFGGVGNGRRLRLGVEFDLRNRRTGYYLWTQHPALRTTEFTSKFVPADNVLHVFRTDVAGQVRGVPWGAPAMMATRELGDWADATVVRAKLAACFTGWITSELDEDPDDVSASVTGKDVEDMEPGIMQRLRPGESVTLSDPPGVEGMEHFPKFTLRSISATFGVPYHLLANDLEGVNYSSAKIGGHDFDAENAEHRIDWLIPQFLGPVVARWLEVSELQGLIARGSTWEIMAPPRTMLEPRVEIEDSRDRVRNGLSTPSAESQMFGWPFEEMIEETARDLEFARGRGVTLDSDPSRPVAGSPVSATAPTPAKSTDAKPSRK